MRKRGAGREIKRETERETDRQRVVVGQQPTTAYLYHWNRESAEEDAYPQSGPGVWDIYFC